MPTRDGTAWLFRLGSVLGATYFQVEGVEGDFASDAEYWLGIRDFFAEAPDPACVTDILVTGVAATDITGTGAVISWTTNVPADSRVAYGTADTYGQWTPLDPAYVTDHSVRIDGLVPGYVYHYRVRSVDEDANVGESPDLTFKTPLCGDGVVDPGEECDGVSPTWDEPFSCGCQPGCRYPPDWTQCDDGDECTSDDTCNGRGSCEGRFPVCVDRADGCGCRAAGSSGPSPWWLLLLAGVAGVVGLRVLRNGKRR